jgi:hypothetical protein
MRIRKAGLSINAGDSHYAMLFFPDVGQRLLRQLLVTSGRLVNHRLSRPDNLCITR